MGKHLEVLQVILNRFHYYVLNKTFDWLKKTTKIVCDDSLKCAFEINHTKYVWYIFELDNIAIATNKKIKYRQVLSRLLVKNKLPYKSG